jgi:hypothetical protein
VTYRTIKVCANRGAFEAFPEAPTQLDLAGVRDRLVAAGIDVVDARVLLIARLEREVTVSRDGRLLIKTQDPDEARRLLERVEPFLRRTSA